MDVGAPCHIWLTRPVTFSACSLHIDVTQSTQVERWVHGNISHSQLATSKTFHGTSSARTDRTMPVDREHASVEAVQNMFDCIRKQ